MARNFDDTPLSDACSCGKMTSDAGEPCHLDWDMLRDGGTADGADDSDGRIVEIAGWMAPFELAECYGYFLLVPEMICCVGCLPAAPHARLEVFAARPIAPQHGAIRLRGRLARLHDDPAGYVHQLREASLVGAAERGAEAEIVSRRGFIGGVVGGVGAALTLAACSPAEPKAVEPSAAAASLLAGEITIDIHSHAGQLIRRDAAFAPVAGPMREGGMAAICLAIVADSGTTRVLSDGRIAAYRAPEPGELYRRSRDSFQRAHRLIADQGLALVVDAASLTATRGGAPGAIVTAEGADFLDRDLARLDEAYNLHHLRHLQLTHYRVNELGDIQTEAPVHGGLTDFGADVIRACNRLGIVVDVAHGTFELVKRAAAVTTTPLVLSHSSLAQRPGPRSRTISPDHARAVAATGGIIGIWPPITIFHDRDAYARGIAAMAEIVGTDHVAIGSDMLGLTSPSVFGDYRELPDLAARLLAVGFDRADAAKILGGNYRRVFAAVTGGRPA
jgi:membrane dipeptidase